MEKFIQKICNDVVEQYKQDKNVLGIMLFGSAARDKFDEYSDVDIYILLNKKGKFSRNNFVKDRMRVDIIFNAVKEVNNYLKEDKGRTPQQKKKGHRECPSFFNKSLLRSIYFATMFYY